MDKFLTPEGLEKLKQELEELKTVKRRELAERLKETASFGDLTENAEYHATKERQAFIEGRILELEQLLREATLVQDRRSKDKVEIGSKIKIICASTLEKESYTIVGIAEARPEEGKISTESPLAKVFLGRSKGETIEFLRPDGKKIQYKIIDIA